MAGQSHESGKWQFARKNAAMWITGMQFTEGIGFAAGACTTLSFIPQLVKIRQQGGRDLSYGMLSVYFFGLVLWLVYGVRLHALAVIAANVVGITLVGALLLLKRSMERPPRLPMPDIMIPEPYACDNPLELFPAYQADAEREKVKAIAYAATRF
jgi:MtN3 and saliva related transmembrane protein